MNNDLMTRYIEFVADRLLTALGHSKLFGSTNPFLDGANLFTGEDQFLREAGGRVPESWRHGIYREPRRKQGVQSGCGFLRMCFHFREMLPLMHRLVPLV